MTMIRRLLLICIPLAYLIVQIGNAQSTFDSLIIASDALGKEGNYLAAFGKAQEAIRADPKRFEGYYYCGYSLYKRHLPADALKFALKAIDLAPAAQREQVKKLKDAIVNSESTEDLEANADRDRDAGLNAKAAKEYSEAWKLSPARDDLGVKAVRMWLQLGELPRAADMLFALRDHPHDDPNLTVAKEVNDLVQSTSSKFEIEYQRRWAGRIAFSSVGQAEQYLENLQACTMLAPSEVEPILEIAGFYASRQDATNAEQWLGKLAHMGKLTAKIILNDERYTALSQSASFHTFLQDTVGKDLADKAAAKSREYLAGRAHALAQATSEDREKELKVLNWRFPEQSETVGLIQREQAAQARQQRKEVILAPGRAEKTPTARVNWYRWVKQQYPDDPEVLRLYEEAQAELKERDARVFNTLRKSFTDLGKQQTGQGRIKYFRDSTGVQAPYLTEGWIIEINPLILTCKDSAVEITWIGSGKNNVAGPPDGIKVRRQFTLLQPFAISRGTPNFQGASDGIVFDQNAIGVFALPLENSGIAESLIKNLNAAVTVCIEER